MTSRCRSRCAVVPCPPSGRLAAKDSELSKSDCEVSPFALGVSPRAVGEHRALSSYETRKGWTMKAGIVYG